VIVIEVQDDIITEYFRAVGGVPFRSHVPL
jgi:hypothetical protein